MKIISSDKPLELVIGNHLGQKQRTINFNITEEQVDDFPQYSYNSVTLAPGVWTYDAIVDALVTEIYPNGKMQAVVNNYLAEPDDAEIKAEFEAMQEWRKTAKAMAQHLLKTA